VVTLAQLGGIILLFLVGLELEFKEIYTKRSFAVAIAGVVVPFVMGYLLSVGFGFNSVKAFFIASTLTATSIGITAAVFRDMGKLNSEVAKIVLGAAVIDDILGLLILSMAISIPAGFSLVALIFVGAAIFLADNIIPRVIDLFDFKYGVENPKLTFMIGMAVAFGFSFVAEIIGLSAIVGAFLAGVTLAKTRSVKFFCD
jgi:Kef-type K+ transport system membrane component KefB